MPRKNPTNGAAKRKADPAVFGIVKAYKATESPELRAVLFALAKVAGALDDQGPDLGELTRKPSTHRSLARWARAYAPEPLPLGAQEPWTRRRAAVRLVAWFAARPSETPATLAEDVLGFLAFVPGEPFNWRRASGETLAKKLASKRAPDERARATVREVGLTGAEVDNLFRHIGEA